MSKCAARSRIGGNAILAIRGIGPKHIAARNRIDVAGVIDDGAMDAVLDDFAEAVVAGGDDRQTRQASASRQALENGS